MKNRDVFVMAWRWLMLHRARTILTVIGLTISTFSLFLVLSYVSYAKGMYFSYADERRNDFILSVPVSYENEKGELISLNSGIIEEIKKIEDVVAVRSIYSVPSEIRSVDNERIDLATEVGVIASWDRFFLPLEENLVLTGERSFTGRIFFENDINKVIIEKSMYKSLQLKANKAEVKTIEIYIDGLVIDLEVIGIIDFSLFPSFSYNYPKVIIQNDQLIGNCTLDSCDIQAVSVLGLYNVKKTLENNKIDLDYRSDEVDARFFEVIILILCTGSLITVGTAVANFISMSINARYFNIGLLKALGYPNHLIKKLFMFECMLISILSSLLGWALSLAGNLMMKKYIQMVLLDGSGVVLARNFGVETIIGIILVIFIALLFAYFTVNKIASIRPINALRGRID